MAASEVAFVDRLCDAFPEVARLREDHLRDQNGELLPHLFLGDVTRYAIALFESSREPARHELTELCRFLEREYTTGTRSVRDLVALGILENMAGPPEPYWRVRTYLGPELRKTIEEMWPAVG